MKRHGTHDICNMSFYSCLKDVCFSIEVACYSKYIRRLKKYIFPHKGAGNGNLQGPRHMQKGRVVSNKALGFTLFAVLGM